MHTVKRFRGCVPEVAARSLRSGGCVSEVAARSPGRVPAFLCFRSGSLVPAFPVRRLRFCVLVPVSASRSSWLHRRLGQTAAGYAPMRRPNAFDATVRMPSTPPSECPRRRSPTFRRLRCVSARTAATRATGAAGVIILPQWPFSAAETVGFNSFFSIFACYCAQRH